MDTHRFFEMEADHFVSDHKEGDELKLGFLKEMAREGSSLLDVGCGNGYFTDKVLAETRVGWACAVDFSRAMLLLNRPAPNKHVLNASVFDLPFRPGGFSFVHVDAVLHHLVSARGSRGASVRMAQEGVRCLLEQVSEGGALILTERCIRGYLGGALSSSLVFYALKWLSGTWIARPFKIPRGLLVCFLTPEEVVKGVEKAGGRVLRMEVTHYKPPPLFRMVLSRDNPRVHLLVLPPPRASAPG